MTETKSDNQYIKCSNCKCKYINDEDHIKIDFGYNRLNVQYKCCVKCRNKGRETYKLNDRAIGDKQHRYYQPCPICNVSIFKYQMDKHQASPACAIYAERAKQ